MASLERLGDLEVSDFRKWEDVPEAIRGWLDANNEALAHFHKGAVLPAGVPVRPSTVWAVLDVEQSLRDDICRLNHLSVLRYINEGETAHALQEILNLKRAARHCTGMRGSLERWLHFQITDAAATQLLLWLESPQAEASLRQAFHQWTVGRYPSLLAALEVDALSTRNSIADAANGIGSSLEPHIPKLNLRVLDLITRFQHPILDSFAYEMPATHLTKHRAMVMGIGSGTKGP